MPHACSAAQRAFNHRLSPTATHPPLPRRVTPVQRIERLKSSLHMLSAEPVNTHTVFVDDADEVEAFDPAAYFDTDPALVTRAFNRPRTADLATAALAPVPPAAEPTAGRGRGAPATVAAAAAKAATKSRKRADGLREQAYAELEERLDRSAKLARLGEHMGLQQELLKKGRREKVADAAGDRPAVFRWKSQRKR